VRRAADPAPARGPRNRPGWESSFFRSEIWLSALPLLLVLALWSGPAHPQAPANEAILLFQQANIHYHLGHYSVAVAKYAAAIQADPKMPGPYRNLALTYLAMKQYDFALPFFRKYLQLAPVGVHSERVRREIETCVAKLGKSASRPLPAGAAQVVLRVSQRGAQVRIDGVLSGSTPMGALALKPGAHKITISAGGFTPWTHAVKVGAGEIVALEVVLKPATGAPRSERERSLVDPKEKKEPSRPPPPKR
jgi:hypothetical protein